MKYLELIPLIILNVNYEPPYIFFKKGTVLFSDISGFTPMSEALSKLGAEGAEILTENLNKYFSKMIGIIKENGGQVMKFGGDAIHCFFPFEESLDYAIKASFEMQEEMKNYKKIKTPVDYFSLSMKIGLAYGDVLIGSFGDPNKRLEYIFAGKPVDRSAEAEHYAKAGEIVLHFEGNDLKIENEKVNKLLTFNEKLKIIDFKEEKIINPYSKAYLIPEIYEIISKGYEKQAGALLDALSIFFQFSGFSYIKGRFDTKKFQEFFIKVNEIVEKYNGRINRVSMGDKGSTALFLFGAPNQIEKKEEVGCQFAIDLKENLKKYFPEIKFKIGMNSGRVFSGIVGGSGRLEYTVMGDSVNFSARLMQSAEEKEVVVSSNIYEKAKEIFEFKYIGEKYFKGKSEAQSVYLLEGRKEISFYEFKETKLFGREKELKDINKFLKDVKEGKPKMVILEGEGGIGKTHLANFIINNSKKDGLKVYQTKGEITLKNHIYAPFREILGKILFDNEISKEKVEKIIKETDESFLEYLPIHLEFFNLNFGPMEMEEETKKKLLQHQISIILLKKIKEEEAIIFLDNLHWFDTLSKELLLAILHHLKDEKLLILVCTREKEDKFNNLPSCHFIEMKEMGNYEIKKILENNINEKLRDELIEFIMKNTKGNPFFSINLFKYLKENNLIEKRLDEWTIKRGIEAKKDFTFNDIISSKISNLSIEEKVHLRVSACIGPTFKKEILKNVLKNDFNEDVFDKLIKNGFFSKIDENTYSFRHALMQETIYQETPERLKKKNHRAIGREMEKNFKDKPDFYPNLANHFYFGGLKEKAGYYSMQAGDFLFEKYAYPEAKVFYERAFNLYKKFNKDFKWESGLKYSKILTRVGKQEISKIILNKISRNAKRMKKARVYLKSEMQKMECLKRVGNYNFINKGKQILKKLRNEKEKNHIRCLIAECFMRKLKFNESIKLFNNILKNKKNAFVEDVTSSYTFLLHIFTIQRKLKDAFKKYREGLLYAEEKQDYYQIIRLKIAYAGALFVIGEIDKAIKELKNLIPLAENLGDLYYLSSIYVNLGDYFIEKKEYQDADFYLNEAERILKKIGSFEGQAYCYNRKGIIEYYRSNYLGSYKYYISSYNILKSSSEKIESSAVFYNLSEVCEKLGRKNEALSWYKKGISSLRKENDPKLYKMYKELKEKIDKM